MKTIYIMRHAKAEPGAKDRIRPLAKKGWQELKNHCKKNATLFSKIQLILCSSSTRTRETLEGLKDCLSDRVTITYIDELYESNAEMILEEISFIDEKFSTIIVIAHNPGVTDFVYRVCHKMYDHMTTSAIAEFNMENLPWKEISFSNLKFVKLIQKESKSNVSTFLGAGA